MIGYGAKMVDPRWPGHARIAVQIALNYEGGAELNVLHGDASSEALLTDTGFPAVAGQRSMLTESSFEFGSRRGVWRLLRSTYQIKMSIFGVAMALERNPQVVRAMVDDGHEMVSHGWRWIDYQNVPAEVERRHIKLARESITRPSWASTCRLDDRATAFTENEPKPRNSTLDQQVVQNYHQGHYFDAIALAERALTLRETALGPWP
jgi:hypothetical protein